jgi:hypothetical protein
VTLNGLDGLPKRFLGVLHGCGRLFDDEEFVRRHAERFGQPFDRVKGGRLDHPFQVGQMLVAQIGLLAQRFDGDAAPQVWSTKLNWENGRVPGYPVPDLFWRCYPFKTDGDKRYMMLQYYWFCTLSDADVALNIADHDGDWMGIDLSIVVSKSDPRNPDLIDVIFHNHDREIIATQAQCQWDGSRVKVFAEDNSNEPWHAPGDEGKKLNGFRTNNDRSIDLQPFATVPREHNGKAPNASVYNWSMVSLGEKEAYGSSPEAQVVMRFEGGWGKNGDTPMSPRFQDRMWKRQFDRCTIVR